MDERKGIDMGYFREQLAIAEQDLADTRAAVRANCSARWDSLESERKVECLRAILREMEGIGEVEG